MMTRTRPSRVLSALRARPGEAPLLSDGAGGIDARQLLAQVDALATTLRARGVRVMATQLDNAPYVLALDLALHCADAVHVPLPTYFSPAQRAHVLAVSGADHFLGASAPGPSWCDAPLLAASCWRRDVTAVALPRGCDLISFTSGTTGQPKGVCLTRADMETVAASLVEASAALRPRRHLCVLPLAELGYSGAAGLDVACLLRCLHRHRPDSVILVPQLLSALVAAGEQGASLPDALRLVAVGGGRVGSDLLRRAQQLGLPVFEGYGLTECASVVCLNRPGATRPGSVGQALSHAHVFVAADGELMVDGVRMIGYLGEPPLPPGPWRTGDLGHVDDAAFVHVRGRRRDVFITAYGRNVSPEWVETELTQQPAIAQAMVSGEARAFNAAVLVARDAEVGDDELQAAVSAANCRLPDYAQVGAWLRAPTPFSAAQGTLTGNGRLQREAIAARYADAIAALYDTAFPSNQRTETA